MKVLARSLRDVAFFGALASMILCPHVAHADETSSTPSVSYSAHVQNVGWQSAVTDGETAGTTGQSLRVEALRIEVEGDLGIEAAAHVQNVGWQSAVGEGEIVGTTGQSLRVEALRISLTGEDAEQYGIWYRVHVQNYGWMAWAHDGGVAGSQGQSLRVEAIQIVVLPVGEEPTDTSGQALDVPFVGALNIVSHVQNIGWQPTVHETQTAGTTGRSLRVEALQARVVDNGDPSMRGGILYNAHVQNVGWQRDIGDASTWFANGETAGTTGKSLRVEAYQFQLTGAIASNYDLYYRAHVQNIGWMGWAEEGSPAGTAGMSRRVEAMQFRLVPKGSAAPASSGAATSMAYMTCPSVGYAVYQNGAWTSSATDGGEAGDASLDVPVTGLRMSYRATDASPAGGIEYCTHVANVGWQDYVSDGATAGSEGGNQVEAIKVRLTGAAASQFDVYYRVRIEEGEWLGWAHNDEIAGSVGKGLRVECVQVRIVAKGASAPGETTGHEYLSGTWRNEGGHWWYYIDGHRQTNLENDITESGASTGGYDVLHDMWVRYQNATSKTDYLIVVNWDAIYAGVFHLEGGQWVPVRGMNCTTGSSRQAYDSQVDGQGWGNGWHGMGNGYWLTCLSPGSAFHTGGGIGTRSSHNVGRVSAANAKWVWDNIPRYTRSICY